MWKWIYLIACTVLMACSQPDSLATKGHGLRVLPSLDGHWLVRWQGDANITVDGISQTARHELRVDGDRSHTIRLAEQTLRLKPRQNQLCSNRRFVVLGDGRAALDGVGPSAYWSGILNEALAIQPDAVFHTGDFVKNGDSLQEWRNYIGSLPIWPPVIGVRGNHDRGSYFDELKIAYGDLYALELGPLLLVGLDSEVSLGRFEEMMVTLDDVLGKQSQRWIVVMLHRPVWSQGNHGSDERGFNSLLVPVLDRHGVDLVLSGHDHNYERFCPSLGLDGRRRCDGEKGVTYLITGGAATFTNHWPGVSRKVAAATAEKDAEMSQVFSGSKHFIALDVEPQRMVLSVHRTRAGNLRPPGLIDRFELTRPMPDCPP